MSFSLHSSTENLGGGRRSSSNGSNSSSSCSDSEKSLIGLMSRNVLAKPSFKNHSKLDRWMAMRSGSSRGSTRLANEYRSRDVGAVATNHSPISGGGLTGGRARRTNTPAEQGQGRRTATDELSGAGRTISTRSGQSSPGRDLSYV